MVDGVNLFAYGRGNPVVLHDPTGTTNVPASDVDRQIMQMTDPQLHAHLNGLSPAARASFAGSATGAFATRAGAMLSKYGMVTEAKQAASNGGSVREGVTTVEHIRPEDIREGLTTVEHIQLPERTAGSKASDFASGFGGAAIATLTTPSRWFLPLGFSSAERKPGETTGDAIKETALVTIENTNPLVSIIMGAEGVQSSWRTKNYEDLGASSFQLLGGFASTVTVIFGVVIKGGGSKATEGGKKGVPREPGPTLDPATGYEVGRFVVDSKGNAMIEPVGGSTRAAGKGGVDTHTTYPNGSNYQRLNPQGHGNNPTPHGHGHLPGIGPGMKGQGPSIAPDGTQVPWNSADAHWSIN